MEGGLYYWDHKEGDCSVSAASIGTKADHKLWHRRLGHVLNKILQQMSLVDSKNTVLSSCLVCSLAKQTRLHFQRSDSRAKKPFDLIHGDVWGPYRLPTHDGKRFFLTLVDDCSRTTWLFLL